MIKCCLYKFISLYQDLKDYTNNCFNKNYFDIFRHYRNHIVY